MNSLVSSMKFPQRLKELRVSLGLSQDLKKIAEKMR